MEGDSSNQEKPVYKKIIEYKKKISLVEGKRRAMFNKFEHEKQLNKEREYELDTELKVRLCVVLDNYIDFLLLSRNQNIILFKAIQQRRFF